MANEKFPYEVISNNAPEIACPHCKAERDKMADVNRKYLRRNTEQLDIILFLTRELRNIKKLLTAYQKKYDK